MIKKDNRTSNNPVLGLCAAHLINDIHSSFLPTFMPFLIESLGLSLSEAGILGSISGLVHIIVQPLAGYLSDRNTSCLSIMAGPFLAALGASMLPISPTYSCALALAIIWALGSAIFHPQGQGNIGYVAQPRHLAFNLSIFTMAGIIGGTLSPLYAVFLFQTVGPGKMLYVAILPVMALFIYFWKHVPGISKPQKARQGLLKTFRSVFVKIWPIWLVTFMRDITNQGLKFLLPLLISFRGGGLGQIGLVLFIVNLAGSISPVIAGKASDIWGIRKTTAVTLFISPLLLICAVMLTGITSILFFVLGKAVLCSSIPLTGALAQKRASTSRGVATSFVSGLSWGLGSILVLPMGFIAEFFNLETALILVSLFPLVSTIVIIKFWSFSSEARD